MNTVGRFLELSVPAPNVPESLVFYRRLGAVELPTNDIRSYAYAAVALGEVVIGLHGDWLEEAAMTSVYADVARHVREQQALGVEFEFRRLGEEQFNEAGWRDANGVLQILVEARTWSGSLDEPAPIFAQGGEISIQKGSATVGFAARDLTKLQRLLADRDLEGRRRGDRLVLLAPEGTTLEWLTP